MDIVLLLKALLLGMVEGLTEFLPVSSTGHLILAGSLLHFTDEKAKVFDVVIQFGAILAVCWQYRARLGSVALGLGRRPAATRFTRNVVLACVPAVLLGLLFGKAIKATLFAPVPVAIALVVGGLVILWAEARQRRLQRSAISARVHSVDELRAGDALKVGLAQCFALLPGTSRSGATIIGGMLAGLDRRVATEFSFFLSIPIIFGASAYELYKARHLLVVSDAGLFAVGLSAAFLSAIVCVRWLLRFVSTHDFTAFAWYRIGFGALILISDAGGWIDWAA